MQRALGANTLFFFNDTATTEIYTLSLHDALPISHDKVPCAAQFVAEEVEFSGSGGREPDIDRKSTRLNSSHQIISYAVFCLKKKTHKDIKSTISSIYTSSIALTYRLCNTFDLCVT